MEVLYWDKIFDKNDCFEMLECGSAVAIGSFDGVHLGHKGLLDKVMQSNIGLKKGVVSFFRPPKNSNKRSISDVLSLRLKLKRFEQLGMDFVLLIDFSDSFGKIKGRAFIEKLVKTICMQYLAVGEDFACGYRRDTGVIELRQIALQLGFGFDSIKRVSTDGIDISSSIIRQSVFDANFSLTEALLGYPFLLDFIGPSWRQVGNGLEAHITEFTQVLPKIGKYNVDIRLDDSIELIGFFESYENKAVLTLGQNGVFKSNGSVVLMDGNIKKIDSIVFKTKE